MFLSRIKKNNVYPCEPQFYYIKVGFKGVEIIYVCFRDDMVRLVANASWRFILKVNALDIYREDIFYIYFGILLKCYVNGLPRTTQFFFFFEPDLEEEHLSGTLEGQK